ncbi:flagellar motor protein MotB [Paenibacillus marinisediminis]
MRRRSRAHNKANHESQDRWLITYADLITLLMIFFVVMYAMSQVDTTKYASLSETLQTTFSSGGGNGNLPGGTGILDGAHVNPGDGNASDNGKDQQNANGISDGDKENNEQSPAVMVGQITEKDLAFRKQEQQLQHVKSTIEQYIQDNNLQNDITITDTPKGIEIRLSDSLLFELGKADLTDAAIPTLDKLSSMFSQLDSTISIEGHTDNLKMAPGARYKDNWELSAERSLSVLRYFVEDKQLQSDKFQIAGYGDTRPIASNDTEEGRKKNRRVEIIILRNVISPQ